MSNKRPVRVCDDHFHLNPGEEFTWENDQNLDCQITPVDSDPNHWPFADPRYDVPAATGPGHPGTAPGHVKSGISGTFRYNVSVPCHRKRGQPRNVTIP